MSTQILPGLDETLFFTFILYSLLSGLLGAVAGVEGWKREQKFNSPYTFVGIGIPLVVAALTLVAASCSTKIDIGIAYWTLIGAVISTAMTIIAYWARKLWALGSESFEMWNEL